MFDFKKVGTHTAIPLFFPRFDIQRELQAVLNRIKENYFHGAFKEWKKTVGSQYAFPSF
jgi:hypothetical protein